MPSDPNMIGVQKLADELKQTEKMLDLLRDAKKQVRELPYIERTNAAYELQEAERKEVMRFNALYYKYRGQHLDPLRPSSRVQALRKGHQSQPAPWCCCRHCSRPVQEFFS